MELATTGNEFYPGYQLPLYHHPLELFEAAYNTGTRFRVVLMENGTGVLNLSGQQVAFLAPTLFCLNENERPEIEQHLNVKARSVYFHPSVINGAFTFEIVRGQGQKLTTATDFQDLYYLRPFIERTAEYHGVLRIGPASAQRLASLFKALAEELALQRDDNWPCRSRSYFLEVLYLAARIFSGVQENETDTLATNDADITEVILHLHSNYQRKITINEMTEMFNTNRTTLNEKFRDATGMSLIAYLIQLRIQLAAILLRDTELPISEILYRVGYSDRTHFSRTFQKHMGHSPSEYREKFSWMLH
ncbi:MAG: AraC family transcriptional regulator [Anaerolineales bacterium]|jgi:AraC-like DNA-binding protein